MKQENEVGLAAYGGLSRGGVLGLSPGADSDARAGSEAPVSNRTGVALEV